MNSNPLFVESLESRIAPAILVNGGNLLGGTGNPTTGETSTGGNTVTIVKVLSGEALVFYDAGSNHIMGISVGKNTRLDLTGNVIGDIVTNLLPDGRLTDSDNNPANGEDGGILLPYKIKGITTHPLQTENGDLGRIIAGGSISNINVNGSLGGIYSGDGIFRDGATASVNVGSVDYNTIVPGLQNVFALTAANAHVSAKANISNVVVHTANELEIFAGNGANSTDSAGTTGGSISNVTITTTLSGQGAKPALFLHAGDGGAGTDGGVGGGITNFDDLGSTAYVKIQTGNGGTASSGAGGLGGSLANSAITTSSPRYDLLMGHGGDGVRGGAGGSISSLAFTNDVLGGRSLIASGDFNGDGIQDVLLINTVTGEGTLSLGTGMTDTPFKVALQPITNADGTAGTTPFIVAEGAVPTGLIATDLNGDASLDFVVSYASTNNLGVFLNHGDGTFSASSVALSASPTAIALGHFTGTTAPSVAVLSGGDMASVSGGSNSQVFLAQDDGAGNFTVLPNPTLVQGFGTDIAAGDIDHVGGTDAFVGLKSGAIAPLFSSGTAFAVGTSVQVFTKVAVDNIDETDVTGVATVLAFSKNTTIDPTLTTVTPSISLVAFRPDGTATISQTFAPDPSAVRAHFVTGTSVIGVVTPGALLLYENVDQQYGVAATLSSDGNLSDFQGSIVNDAYHIVAVGAATNRFFYTDGALDSVNGLPALKNANVPFEERNISFVSGDGGAGTSSNGGNGGGIKGLTYIQTLGSGVLQAGGGYNTFVTTGNGGASGGSTGGRGGDISTVSLSLNPGYLNDHQDDTDFALVSTGNGGDGAAGGAGGGIVKTTSNSVFSDTNASGVILGSVVVQLEGGNGGVGSATTGGVGGSITLGGPASLSGVTFYDTDSPNFPAPALLAEAGNGGAGNTAGGAGGSLTNVGAQNATIAGADYRGNELFNASLVGGSGGAATHGMGGAGGSVTGFNVGVDGSITATGGKGGDTTNGIGGAGGSVVKSTAASANAGEYGVYGVTYGVLITGGEGGDGTSGGGAGGGLKKLTVNTPSSTDIYAGVLAAGNGGTARIDGAGGAGGNVKGVSQNKDVNSAITAILGGSGGTSGAGTGGVGGSVKNVDTVGFIGLPANDVDTLGVFDPDISSPVIQALFADGQVTQGIYAGRGAGGSGNGSVHNVVARQIAAIGAVVDEQGLFGVAAAVTKVNADLIGYEVVRDNVFQSSAAGSVSPAAAVPVDGFILAASVSGVTTLDPARTAAFTFNG